MTEIVQMFMTESGYTYKVTGRFDCSANSQHSMDFFFKVCVIISLKSSVYGLCFNLRFRTLPTLRNKTNAVFKSDHKKIANNIL